MLKELQIGIMGILYGVEPLLWLYVMSSASPVRKKKALYYFAALGYYVLSVLKQYCVFRGIGQKEIVFLTFLVQMYIIFATILLFAQTIRNTCILLGIFFICNLSIELICVEVFMLVTQKGMDEISLFGISNMICTIAAKLFLSIFCYLFVNKKKEDYFNSLYCNEKLLPLVASAVIFELPFTVVFRFPKQAFGNTFVLSFFLFSQIYLLAMTVYVMRFLLLYYGNMEKMKEELQKSRCIHELKQSILKVQHDMSFSVSMIRYFVEKKQYEELEEFVQGMAEELEKTEDIFILPNQAVANTLNLMARQARKKQVQFEHIITGFGGAISNHDLSILLFNILQNAIEAARAVETDKRKVLLEMGRRQGGYYINCLNTYEHRPQFVQELFSTSKKNKLRHGKGLSIMKRITEQNGGVMKIHVHDTLFEIDCFIPDRKETIKDA